MRPLFIAVEFFKCQKSIGGICIQDLKYMCNLLLLISSLLVVTLGRQVGFSYLILQKMGIKVVLTLMGYHENQ